MGFLKGLMGAKKPIPLTTAPAPKPAIDPNDPDVIADEARKRRIALNAGPQPGQMTPAGGAAGQATVQRKTLLGL